ncbi:MAG TPA: GxxExxY protein [Candidatus Syntrophosphaera sp.]|nr:GxxExxY protein [Candidatus Syntrophosphaera sp.]
MKLNDVTYKVRSAKFEVYNELVPSLLESTYEAALAYEFGKIV